MATPTTLPASFVAGNVLTAAQMNNLRGAFRVLQIASTAKTDTFSTTSTTMTDITGLSVSITPSATSSKVLVLVQLAVSGADNSVQGYRLMRGSTAICIGDAAGSRTQGAASARITNAAEEQSIGVVFLDSPSTTSATTYKMQAQTGGGTLYVNRTSQDSDVAAFLRTLSTITVMEISA